MLPLIKFTPLALLIFMTPALAEGGDVTWPSVTWIMEMTRQAETYAKTYQEEARSIVKRAIVHQNKQCKTAQDLAQQGKEIASKSLESKVDEARYPKLLVFVSFSMPLPTLKALGSQVYRVGGKLVLRGLVEGNFRETAKKLQELQEEILIDPTLFEDYGISTVPTFVLRSESTRKVKDGSYDRLSGNVSLEYALEQFSSKGEAHEEARLLLKKFRGLP
jgi:type-F conjugative transfer system pilin assembly protein TrbC